jgi:nitroimidazol reductase NimA-like FMN-containing flavoprotein (pyridoxamine 5'-phosphate oxidase superfamily)
MKTHQLTESQIESLLSEEQVGRLATLNDNGSPYITPVHFVYFNQKIYIHGLIKGQKINNIKRDNKVCFEVDKIEGYLMAETPCDVNTQYQSVIILGDAKLLDRDDEKIEPLNKIVEKYTPSLAGKVYPEDTLRGTSVIEVSVIECTGKYYKEQQG